MLYKYYFRKLYTCSSIIPLLVLYKTKSQIFKLFMVVIVIQMTMFIVYYSTIITDL